MKVLLHSIFLLMLAIFFSECHKNNVYEEKSRSLDSLSGVVNSALRSFEKNVDSVVLEKSLLRFQYYREFIQQNINDTLNKPEADNLRRFYSSGKSLTDFASNRKLVIQRLNLLNDQLTNLSKDVKEKLVEPERLVKYAANEYLEVGKATDLADAQQKVYQVNQEEFKNALKGVENLIRSRNNGELPVIIKDTVSL
ncbi:MAG: hypothetical protein JNL60_16110 [Bacteroidia bacterium]|nr:hypothetical protein [Bacteroidia bacterium]